MTQEERKRLELLFELENIKANLMYIAPRVNLKAIYPIKILMEENIDFMKK